MSTIDPLKMFYSSTPFDLFFGHPTQQRVVVISDSEYQKYKQEKAQQEIAILQSKRNRYNTAIEEIDVQIKDLEESYALLPSSNESSN